MFEVPQTGDLDRNLSSVMHNAYRLARKERGRIQSEYTAKGVGRSGGVITSIADRMDEIHAAAIQEAMRVLHDFVVRMQVPATQVAKGGLELLDNMANPLLGEIPKVGMPDIQCQVHTRYHAVFRQRLEGAIRDIEIGFIGGRSMPVTDADRRAVVLRKFYDARHSQGWLSVPVESAASKEEKVIAANICRQLGQSMLIEWKGLEGTTEGMGRITNIGIDVVEGNLKPPIAINVDSRQFTIHNSSNVQIGDGNAQDLSLAADKIVAAINGSSASEQEKAQARSLVQSIINSPVLSKLLGWILPA
jgi:hypothetical protein